MPGGCNYISEGSKRLPITFQGEDIMNKLARLFCSLHKREEGITGLETAIILIAFVIVASVFAFVVLSTGLFSAERGKETVFAGLEKARGNLELRGAVTITDTDSNGIVDSADEIKFNLANAAGGFPVNVDPAAYNNTVAINWIDEQARVADLVYSITWIQAEQVPDTLLETGELAEITVNLPAGSTLIINETFTVEVIPPYGGTLLINRTMPPSIDTVIDLH
jgi:flagellin FlaB